MTEKPAEAEAEQGAALFCETCHKPKALCVCAAIAPIDNRLFVLILQHPQEQDKELGTARIAELVFKQSRLVAGLSWPSLRKLLGRDIDMKRWGVLYLGTARTTAATTGKPKTAATAAPAATLVAVNTKGVPLPDQAAVLANLEGIILLDGTWAQAKALWWRNPWLLKARRLVLNPGARSLYGALRREPRPESLSTLESAAYCLAALEGREDIVAPALAPFKLLLDKYRRR